MGQIFACCGHEVFGEQAFTGYVWRGYDCESDDGVAMCYGNICPKCIDVYNAVESTGDTEKDEELLKDKSPVGLIDILSKQYDKPIETKSIGGVDWQVLEI